MYLKRLLHRKSGLENEHLKLENGFNRKDDLNSIIRQFREVFYRKKNR